MTTPSPEKLLAGFGVLFDVDGTLVDSYQAHFQSWRAMLQRHGLDVTEEQFRRTFGRTNEDIFENDFPSFRREDYTALGDEKEAAYREIIREHFPAMPGASELLATLRQAGATLAVGSSAPPENLEVMLRFLAGTEHITAATHGKEVSRGKPDPEVFVTSARKIGVEPRKCVVVEDAPAGVSAGKAAGCKVIALTGTAPREELTHADLVVDSLSEITPRSVLALLRQEIQRES
ncbi:MAG: HAD family phosphatase [Phycisphaerae bacterium]|nr:HAD family phosphatase [Phycisphaerae bacterium]